MTTEEKTRKVLEKVAQGVWQEHHTSFGVFHQCVFCCVAPANEHDDTCPVRLAREVLG